MKEGQTAIYYLTGDSLEAAARSPQLEGYRAKGIEVLLLTDGVDEFWVPAVGEYEGKSFKSVTRGGADLDAIKGDAKAEEKKPEPAAAGIDNLIALMKLTLKDAVKDVRVSQRLTDSAVLPGRRRRRHGHAPRPPAATAQAHRRAGCRACWRSTAAIP